MRIADLLKLEFDAEIAKTRRYSRWAMAACVAGTKALT